MADYDGDGKFDFLLTGNPLDTFSGSIYLQDDSGNFKRTIITSTDAERSYSSDRLLWESDGNIVGGKGSDRLAGDVLLGDINNDGLIDMVASGFPNEFDGAWPTFINRSTPGNLQFEIVYTVNPVEPFQTPGWANGALLDINDDGLLDLVTSLSVAESLGTQNVLVNLFVNSGGGKFVLDNSMFGPSQPSVIHARQWLVSDFNLDGIEDLFIADHGEDFDPFPGSKNLLLENRGGVLEDVTSNNLSSVSSYTHGAAIGDVNGDGYPDIFMNNDDCSDCLREYEPRLWINNGDGSFTSSSKQKL